MYVSSFHSAPISENIGRQVFNSTRIPAEHVYAMDSVELHTSRTVTAVHDLTTPTVKTNPTANNSHDEPDVSGDVLDQNTQPPTMTTEPSGKYDDLTTESAEFTEKNREEVADDTTTTFSLENTGSGTEEPIDATTSEPNTEGSKDKQEDHINYTSESPPGMEQETTRFPNMKLNSFSSCLYFFFLTFSSFKMTGLNARFVLVRRIVSITAALTVLPDARSILKHSF